ncbi:hypothetical protein EST38_g10394 [Candolleomyces aberdarensis]|uniref:Sucrose transporter n=1 Tax=Candolleomyces aberdarensis TaxID=2316362 RepID=A0A4Q2D7G4_9AGAR|nr:hypothetical protein EST38_g10394 [Candolleomyces aberdarensis]
MCMLAMLLLGFTRPVASIFTSKGSDANGILTIWLAILAIYLIDFGINAVQAVDRALLVDTLPPADQASGNAWAARMLGVGSVVGFFVGNIDLTRIFPFLGSTQLECLIQFFAWIAWFPVLFYSTLYVGDLHKQVSPLPATDEARASLDAEATRLGSRALFFSSVVALAANILLPSFVPEAKSAKEDESTGGFWKRICKVPAVLQIHLATLWAASHVIFAGCMFATFFVQSVWGATILITVTGFSWAITQWAPFSLLAEAILTEPGPATADDGGSIRLADTRTNRSARDAESERFLQDSDSDEDDEEEEDAKKARQTFLGNSAAQVSNVNIHETHQSDDDYEMVDNQRSARRVRNTEDDFDPDQRSGGGLSAKAGIILGIHNVFIVIPQFLVTGLSSIVFAIFDPRTSVTPSHPLVNGTAAAGPTSTLKNATDALENTILRRSDAFLDLSPRESADMKPGQSSSIVYIFRFGGFTAMIAFVLCWRLARALRHR